MSLCIIRFFFKAGFFLYPYKFVAQETFAHCVKNLLHAKPLSLTSNKDLAIGSIFLCTTFIVRATTKVRLILRHKPRLINKKNTLHRVLYFLRLKNFIRQLLYLPKQQLR